LPKDTSSKNRWKKLVQKDAFKLGNKEIAHVIEAHTRESGVRNLEKQIAKISRWVALQITMEKEYDPKKMN
jgi:ATP-dependent Lon protease